MKPELPVNCSIRAPLLAQYEARLKKLLPDNTNDAPALSFDAIEAVAVQSGDETARALMSRALAEAMTFT